MVSNNTKTFLCWNVKRRKQDGETEQEHRMKGRGTEECVGAEYVTEVALLDR